MESRKRKRTFHTNCLSFRSLLYFLCFILLLLFFCNHSRIETVSFRPTTLIVPSLKGLSSSVSNSVQVQVLDLGSTEFIVQSRVLLPDHVLVILSSNRKLPRVHLSTKIDCVYHRLKNESSSDQIVVHPSLSGDVYDGVRWVVRCPVPPANYSAAVSMNGIHVAEYDWLAGMNGTVHNWDRVAYEAVLDGDVVVVFVKGLNLRSDRESDPTQFSCHFKAENLEKSKNFELTTKAKTAAQEVIRCPLPHSMRMNPGLIEGVHVSISMAPRVYRRSNARGALHITVPSVAKIYEKRREKEDEKYDVCACTMVWNQAAFVREWITYHSWLGVQRWFIYDNNSDDDLKEVVEKLDSENYNVSRHVWPWIKSQEAGFSHCALRAREECNWVAFFDVDEFYYFRPANHHRVNPNLGPPGRNSLRALVANFSSSPTTAEIRTDCHSFGPSGLRKNPVEGVTLGYTCRIHGSERHKSIIRPDGIHNTLMNHVHHFRLKKGFKYMNLPQSIAVVNHYKYQVWEVFKAKFYRRVSTYVADWQENHNEGSRDRAPGLGTEAIEPPDWHLRFCKVRDTGLREFILANLVDPTTGLPPWGRSSL